MGKKATRKINKNVGFLLLLVWIIGAVLLLNAMAATSGSGSTGESGFSWSWSTDNTNTDAGGTFTGTLSGTTLVCNISASSSTFASGDCGGNGTNAKKTTNTATITNNTGSTIKIDSVSCDTASVSGLVVNGSLENGKSFVITIVANPNDTNDHTSREVSGTVTITYTVVEKIDIVFYGAANATYMCGDVTVSGIDHSVTVTQTPGSTIILPKVTVSSGEFKGWRMNDGSIQQSGAEVTVNSDSTVYPVVVQTGQIKPFTVGETAYEYWADAAYAAGNSGTIILNQNYTLPTTMEANGVSPAGCKFVTRADGNVNYVVPSGVTLLIPCDAANTVYTTAPATSDVNSLTKPYAFRTLTMASGANIVVNGAISIAGTQHSVMAKGTPFGPVGFIKMNGNSSITINSGAKLYAWGYITGTGSVTVKSGGNVYECFQISDWRGGSATSAMLKNDEKIFPMSQYYVQNIEVPLTLEAGAKEHGFMSVKVSIVGIKSTLVSFIGDDGMFQIAGGSLTKDYDEANDRLVVSLNNANVSISPYTISVDAGTFGASITINSADYVLPITTNLTLNVNSGSTVTLSQDIAFLPGSEVNIEEGANCLVTSNSNIYVYDADDWGAYCGAGNAKLTTIAYAPGKLKTRTAADLVDAAVKINGTVDASAGYIYTTAGGANIYSTGSGELIQCAGTNTVTYQATYVKDGYTANEIAVTPAQLHNGGAENIYSGEGNEYTPTADATEKTTYNHCPDCLMWYTGSHTCAAAATYSVTITWNQTDVAVYTPGQTTYTWDPVNLKYSDSTTEGSWNDTQSVMTITINNSKSTGAVTASFVYNKQLHATESWTGLTNNALAVEAGKTGSASLTLTPTGTPTAPTDGTDTIILGTITITLSKENNST